MTAQSLSMIASTPGCGLANQHYIVPTTGLYTLEVKCWVPYQTASSNDSSVTTGGSALTIDLKQDHTVKLTIAAPSPTEPFIAGSVQIQATAGDDLNVAFNSSAAVDKALNAVKWVINVFQGQGA